MVQFWYRLILASKFSEAQWKIQVRNFLLKVTKTALEIKEFLRLPNLTQNLLESIRRIYLQLLRLQLSTKLNSKLLDKNAETRFSTTMAHWLKPFIQFQSRYQRWLRAILPRRKIFVSIHTLRYRLRVRRFYHREYQCLVGFSDFQKKKLEVFFLPLKARQARMIRGFRRHFPVKPRIIVI